MATKYYSFTGVTKWVNGQYGGLFEPDPKYGNFSVILYPDPKSWDRFKQSGLALEPRTDEDGDSIRFRRPEQKLMKKELVKFGRPKVFFKEGIEPTRDIGNGSTIEVNVAVYDTGQGKGHRLESVRVLDLVKYERGGAVGNFIEYTEDGEGSKPVEEVSSDTSVKKPVKQETPPWEDEVPFGEKENTEVEEPETKKPSASPFRKSR